MHPWRVGLNDHRDGGMGWGEGWRGGGGEGGVDEWREGGGLRGGERVEGWMIRNIKLDTMMQPIHQPVGSDL